MLQAAGSNTGRFKSMFLRKGSARYNLRYFLRRRNKTILSWTLMVFCWHVLDGNVCHFKWSILFFFMWTSWITLHRFCKASFCVDKWDFALCNIPVYCRKVKNPSRPVVHGSLISTLPAWNPYKRVQRNEPESFHLWARAGCRRLRQTWVPFITTNNLEQIRWSCICMISVCFSDSERPGFQLCCHSAQPGLTALAVQPKMNSFEFLARVTSCNWESWNKNVKAVAQLCKTLTGVSAKRMISLKKEVWILSKHLYRLLDL